MESIDPYLVLMVVSFMLFMLGSIGVFAMWWLRPIDIKAVGRPTSHVHVATKSYVDAQRPYDWGAE